MTANTGAGSAAATSLDAALGALADPLRRRTVELLAAGPRRAGELASALGVNAPTMSKHLKVLRRSGLVTDTAPTFDTRVRIYQLRAEPLAGLHRWLADTAQAWSDQLEKLGVVREGTLREDCFVGGEIPDSWVFGLLSREWRSASDTPHIS